MLDTTALPGLVSRLAAGRPDPTLAPVRLFVMGENTWRDEQEWPLARTGYTPWYLQQDGGLFTGCGPAGGAT